MGFDDSARFEAVFRDRHAFIVKQHLVALAEAGTEALGEVLPGRGVTQQEVLELASQGPAELPKAVQEAGKKPKDGKSGKSEGGPAAGKKTRPSKAGGSEEGPPAYFTVELKAEPGAIAKAVFDGLGKEKSLAIYQELGGLLGVKKKR
jgi:hypothetical protein